jgi:hypothetical protein
MDTTMSCTACVCVCEQCAIKRVSESVNRRTPTITYIGGISSKEAFTTFASSAEFTSAIFRGALEVDFASAREEEEKKTEGEEEKAKGEEEKLEKSDADDILFLLTLTALTTF